MKINTITKLAAIYEKLCLARIYSLTTYHGTDVSNIPGIVQKGLLAKKPEGLTSLKGVYLTNTIETAARYACVSANPVVLELTISSPKRIDKIVWDELDRDEDLYDDASEPFWHESESSLKRDISKVLEYTGYGLPGSFPSLPHEIEGFRGLNIYKEILNYARNNNMDVQQIKKSIQEIMPPGTDYEYFEIAQDGTLTLTGAFYDAATQMVYPESLPSIAIKAVWLPLENIKPEFRQRAVDTEGFGSRLLPGDISNINDEWKSVCNRIFSLDKKDEEESKEIMESVVDSLEFVDPHKITKDYIVDLKRCIENNDAEEFKDIIYNFEWLDAGEMSESKLWGKFNINGPAELLNIPNMIQS